MEYRDTLIIKIKHVIEVLSKPLPAEEIASGWTKKAQREWLKYFEGLLHDLNTNKVPNNVQIARAMDHWGIVSGSLLEEAAIISNQIREIKA